MTTLSPRSLPSKWKLVISQASFAVIVTRNFLEATFDHFCISNAPLLSPAQLVDNRQKVLWNPTGKSWYICPGLILLWYYAIKHAAWMMNMIPGPFMLVHGVRPYPRTWLPKFSLCYFHHEKDSDASRSKLQAHTLDRIIIGRSPTSNAILIYNPRNQRYYKPDSYKIDTY